MRAEKTFDAGTFERAFQEAMPGHSEKFERAAREKSESKGFGAMGLPMPLFDARAAGAAGFCKLWPKVKGFVLLAITPLAWFYPSLAAATKSFLAAFETTVLPMVCPIDE